MDLYREATAQRHTEQLTELVASAAKPDTLVLGDSYFERLLWNHDLDVHRKSLAPLRPAIFAKGGDKVEHLNWRIKNLLENLPDQLSNVKRIILFIGLNNGAKERALTDKIQCGIDRLRTVWPTVPLYVLTLPPVPSIAPASLVGLNTSIQRLTGCTVIDPWAGIGDPTHFCDHIHLSPTGYQIWLDNLLALIA